MLITIHEESANNFQEPLYEAKENRTSRTLPVTVIRQAMTSYSKFRVPSVNRDALKCHGVSEEIVSSEGLVQSSLRFPVRLVSVATGNLKSSRAGWLITSVVCIVLYRSHTPKSLMYKCTVP
jgi:hypothetical protein